tara:strand:+ start:2255 stop:2842 length:588 start_codon:yes stop_codon:yes gene_type:complete
MITALVILLLAFLQNITFSMNSRARNRSSTKYHLTTSIASNIAWFMCFRELDHQSFGMQLLLPYVTGTAIGSIVGSNISMRVEKHIDASADGHLKTAECPDAIEYDVYGNNCMIDLIKNMDKTTEDKTPKEKAEHKDKLSMLARASGDTNYDQLLIKDTSIGLEYLQQNEKHDLSETEVETIEMARILVNRLLDE